MLWEVLGLLAEFLFLGAGIYLYLFAIDRLNFKSAEAKKKAEEFRSKNGGMIRILALLLMAIMLVNIVVHIGNLMK